MKPLLNKEIHMRNRFQVFILILVVPGDQMLLTPYGGAETQNR